MATEDVPAYQGVARDCVNYEPHTGHYSDTFKSEGAKRRAELGFVFSVAGSALEVTVLTGARDSIHGLSAMGETSAGNLS